MTRPSLLAHQPRSQDLTHHRIQSLLAVVVQLPFLHRVAASRSPLHVLHMQSRLPMGLLQLPQSKLPHEGIEPHKPLAVAHSAEHNNAHLKASAKTLPSQPTPQVPTIRTRSSMSTEITTPPKTTLQTATTQDTATTVSSATSPASSKYGAQTCDPATQTPFHPPASSSNSSTTSPPAPS